VKLACCVLRGLPSSNGGRLLDSQIYALKAIGSSLRSIADIVGYHVSNISREISKNTGGRGYRYKQANAKAVERRTAASSVPKKMTPTLVARIESHLLDDDWSPEQISGRLERQGVAVISVETIYKHIRKDRLAGGVLYKNLRHRGKKYNKRGSAKTAGRGLIPNRVDIDERPEVVEEKSRIGDWEGDTIVGAQHQGAIVSYVDRRSKFVVLKQVDRKTSNLVTQGTLEKLNGLPVLTITYDNGKEFAEHMKISSTLDAACYFAKPYHSWERGLNEHTNGLVRQYLPKGTNLREVSDETVQAIADKLNHRPRKSLGYQTPMEVFMASSQHTNTVVIRDG